MVHIMSINTLFIHACPWSHKLSWIGSSMNQKSCLLAEKTFLLQQINILKRMELKLWRNSLLVRYAIICRLINKSNSEFCLRCSGKNEYSRLSSIVWSKFMYMSIWTYVLLFAHMHVHLDLCNHTCIIRFKCDSPVKSCLLETCGLWFLSHCPLLYTWLMLQLKSTKPNVEVKEIKEPVAPEKKVEQVSSLMWLFHFYGVRSPEICCSCRLLIHLTQWPWFS